MSAKFLCAPAMRWAVFIVCLSVVHCAASQNETIADITTNATFSSSSSAADDALINQTGVAEGSTGATTSSALPPATTLLEATLDPEIFEFLSSFDEPPLIFNYTINSDVTCAADEYQCAKSGECIPRAWCCDHVIDCSDATDEWPNYTPPRTNNQTLEEQCTLCSGGSFQCPLSAECIPRGWMCDGQLDCGQTVLGADMGDEVAEICTAMGEITLEEDTGDNLTAVFILEPTKPFAVLYNQSMILRLVKSFFNTSRVFPNTKAPQHSQNISELVTITKDRRLCWLDAIQRTIECLSMLHLIVAQKSATPLSSLDSAASLMETTLEKPPAPSETIAAAMPADQPKGTALLFHLPAYIEASSVRRLLLDWLTDNWYLLDGTSELLYLCSSTLTECRVIADHTLLSRPLALELDATEGLLFIARHGDRSRFGPHTLGPAILRCSLDGANVQTLVDVRLVEPRHLAIDVPARKLYWIDVYLDTLEQVNFDGGSRQQVKVASTGTLPLWSSAHSIFAHAEKLYLLMSPEKPPPAAADRRHPASEQITFATVDMETHLFHQQAYHSEEAVAVQSTIVYNVADASLSKLIKLLCLKCTEKRRSICVPQFDYIKMQIISVNCLSSLATTQLDGNASSLLIYSRGEPGQIQIGTIGHRPQLADYPPVTSNRCPTLFDMDPLHGRLFHLDDCNQRLLYHSLIQTAKSPVSSIDLRALGYRQIEALAFDWSDGPGNVYLLDSGAASVTVFSLANATRRRTLLSGLANPKALIVDPRNGLLFVSQYGDNLFEEDAEEANAEQGMFIKRANMDGTKAKIVQKGPYLRFPNSLTVDAEARHLYWCDAFHHRIERINYDGTGRLLLIQGLRIGIANSLFFDATAKVLYWSELQHGTVQAFDLQSNTSAVVLQQKAPIFHVAIHQPDHNRTATTMMTETAETLPHCEQLRLLTKNGPVCACADGFVADATNSGRCNAAATTAPIVPVNDATSAPCASPADSKVSCLGSGADGGALACSSKHFSCDQRRRCIPYHWQCDGHKDCLDRSDEPPANGGCHNATCPPTMFRCAKRQICIDSSWRCDSMADCGPDDDSDERDC